MTAPLTTRLRIAPDVLFREIDGEAVLLNLKTGIYFGLDPVGTRIWQLLKDHGRLDQVLAALTQEYAVAEARGRRDLMTLTAALEQHGLVERAGA